MVIKNVRPRDVRKFIVEACRDEETTTEEAEETTSTTAATPTTTPVHACVYEVRVLPRYQWSLYLPSMHCKCEYAGLTEPFFV